MKERERGEGKGGKGEGRGGEVREGERREQPINVKFDKMKLRL